MSLEDAQRYHIDLLKKQLAATEVQRDAALEACQDCKDAWHNNSDWPHIGLALEDALPAIEAALSLTPERAASVVEERDRYKLALTTIAYGDVLHVGLVAREALETPAKGEDS